jgi:hypothetical protein
LVGPTGIGRSSTLGHRSSTLGHRSSTLGHRSSTLGHRSGAPEYRSGAPEYRSRTLKSRGGHVEASVLARSAGTGRGIRLKGAPGRGFGGQLSRCLPESAGWGTILG